MAMNIILYFLIWVTLIKIANTPLDRSTAVSVINLTYCNCTGVCTALARNLAGAGLGQIFEKRPDSGFALARAEMRYSSSYS